MEGEETSGRSRVGLEEENSTQEGKAQSQRISSRAEKQQLSLELFLAQEP